MGRLTADGGEIEPLILGRARENGSPTRPPERVAMKRIQPLPRVSRAKRGVVYTTARDKSIRARKIIVPGSSAARVDPILCRITGWLWTTQQ